LHRSQSIFVHKYFLDSSIHTIWGISSSYMHILTIIGCICCRSKVCTMIIVVDTKSCPIILSSIDDCLIKRRTIDDCTCSINLCSPWYIVQCS
jgi:hypothetical protein